MKPLQLISICLLICGAPSLFGQSSTVNFSAGVGQRDVIDASGTMPLAQGNTVKVGYFDPVFNVSAASHDLVALSSAWKEFGSTTIISIFGQDGRFSATQDSSDPLFSNQDIWLWIFQTVDNTAPTANMDNVTGYGLFTSSMANWVFPQLGGLPFENTTSVNSSEVNQAMFGFFDSSHLILQPIPEPSLVALISLIGCGLVLFRKKAQPPAKQ